MSKRDDEGKVLVLRTELKGLYERNALRPGG